MVNSIWRVVAALVVLQAVCLPAQAFCQWTEQVIDPAMAGDDKALVDVDGDGYLDIVAGGKRVEDEPLSWYHYPDWRKYVIAVAVDEFTTEMDVGDMDGDGDMDLVVCDGQSGVNCRYYVNPRPGGDPRQQAAWTSRDIGSGGGWVHDVRVGDHNRDGRLDVLTNRGLFTRNGDGSFTKSDVSGGAFGDVDGDGDLDIVAPGQWYENPGWAQYLAPGGGGNEEKVRVADLDHNGTADIILNSGDGTGDLAWYSSSNPKGGAWSKHLVAAAVPGGHSLAVGDIDGDGDLDLLSAEMFHEVAVFLNTGGGAFVKQLLSTAGAHNAVLGDVDKDGDLDVMGCNYTGNPPLRLWRNQGSVTPVLPVSGPVISPMVQLLLSD